MTDRLLIARIGAPHGVRGEVRLFAFGEDPDALKTYVLTDAAGTRTFKVASLRPAKDHFVARLKGVDDRDAAEALTNTDLFVPRTALPPAGDDDTFYQADMIGLSVMDEAGTLLGTVTAMFDFGAGDILEYAPVEGSKTLLVPFTKEAVPVVDLAARRVVVAQVPDAAGGDDAPDEGEETDGPRDDA